MDRITIKNWLELQCQMIPNVVVGLLLPNNRENEPGHPPLLWPEHETKEDPELTAAADLARLRNAPVISAHNSSTNSASPNDLIIAYPLQVKDQPFGILSLRAHAEPNQQAILLQLIRWGMAWLELLETSQQKPATKNPTLITLLLEKSLTDSPPQATATTVSSTIAQALSCSRVSIGLVHNRSIRLCGLSQGVNFDPRSRLVRQIVAAMDEALTCGPVHYHPSQPLNPLPAHEALATNGTERWIYSIPLPDKGETIGILTLETGSNQPLSADQLAACNASAQLIGPILRMKQQINRSPLKQFLKRPLEKLLGPGHLGWKLSLGGLAALVLSTSLISGDYRINATANIEGREQRAIVAPFDGYVTAVHRRAGETIKAGDLLAELDDKQLRLERRRWSSQQEEHAKKYRKALAKLDHAEARIADAQAAQARAQLSLLDDQLQRTRLQSPLNGVIIEGDLSQSLGSPVERGQVLFQLAPLDEYRVALQVDERDIPDIVPGQAGSLLLSSLPKQPIPIEVTQVAAISSEGENGITFRVEAHLLNNDHVAKLRPGMQGIGKIMAGSEPLLWIWSRPMVGWLQLRLWAWWP